MSVVPSLAIEHEHRPPPGADLGQYVLPAAFAATAVLGALGAIGSFAKVSASAVDHQIDPPWLLPIGVDGAIAVFTALDLALAREGKRVGWLRWFAWGLIASTVALNVAGETDLFGIVAHAALPLLWAATVEAAKAVMVTRATVATDRIPLARWVCAPFPTLRLWRRMRVWGIESYAEALDLERRRMLARLVDRHGSLEQAPARKQELYRLIAAAAGIDLEPAPPVADPDPESAEDVLTVAAPARRRIPAKKPARPSRTTDDELADAAVALARKDATVVAGWQRCAEALRADGWKFGNDRIRNTVLDLARTRMKENPDG